MPRSPTLLVLGSIALLLLWSGAAGWSCRPRTRPCRREQQQLPAGGTTRIVPKPIASHNINNREIHALSKTSKGGLRGVFGVAADMHRSKKCICVQPFCHHPQGRAQEGHEEIHITPHQQDLYYPSQNGWVCSDMLFPQDDTVSTMREPRDRSPPPSRSGVAGDRVD